MKIWYGYGSEHSNNLVMIGHFSSVEDAEETRELFQRLTTELQDKIEVGAVRERFDEHLRNLLIELDCFLLNRWELEQFLYDVSYKVEDNKIIVTTEESDVSAFLKLMIHNSAKVEVYSAHDYPETDFGRGK